MAILICCIQYNHNTFYSRAQEDDQRTVQSAGRWQDIQARVKLHINTMMKQPDHIMPMLGQIISEEIRKFKFD